MGRNRVNVRVFTSINFHIPHIVGICEHQNQIIRENIFFAIQPLPWWSLLLRWKLTKNTKLFVTGAEIKFPPFTKLPVFVLYRKKVKNPPKLLLEITIFHENVYNFWQILFETQVNRIDEWNIWLFKNAGLWQTEDSCVFYGKNDFN